MPTQVNNFLLSLAAAIATAASLTVDETLSIHESDEPAAGSEAVRTVLRIYPGSETAAFAGTRRPNISVQADTRGRDSQAVLAQAWAVHEALLDDEGRPRMHWAIAGKVYAEDGAVADDDDGDWVAWVKRLTTTPGIVGRDESDRRIATGNFDIEFDRGV